MKIENTINQNQAYSASNTQSVNDTKNTGNISTPTNESDGRQSELNMLRLEVGSRLAYGNFVQFSEANFRNMSETGEMTVNAETQARMRDDFNARTENILAELLQNAEQGTTRYSLIEQWLTALRDGGTFNLFDVQG
jgi:hypothetical protein